MSISMDFNFQVLTAWTSPHQKKEPRRTLLEESIRTGLTRPTLGLAIEPFLDGFQRRHRRLK